MKRTRNHGFATAIRLLAVALVLDVVSLNESAAVDRPFRIALLVPGDQYLACVAGLKAGMKQLDLIEGRDVQYFLENSGGDKAKLVEMTKKHLAEKVNLIFTVTNTALQYIAPLAKPSKMPVVFGSAAGPVESGIVPAYATPDALITGVASGSIELTEKRLDVLREIFPHHKKIAFFVDVTAESSKAAAALARKAAPRLGFTLVERWLSNKQQVIEAAKKLTSKEADVLFLLPGANTNAIGELAVIAKEKRMPFLAFQIEHVKDHGALLSYGSSYFLTGKQSARLVSRVLKGSPVYQLPIERPEKYELILNLDTAKAIGVKFSPAIISRADQLIRKDKDS
jgi:putative ABC transport system substrate-binding protein